MASCLKPNAALVACGERPPACKRSTSPFSSAAKARFIPKDSVGVSFVELFLRSCQSRFDSAFNTVSHDTATGEDRGAIWEYVSWTCGVSSSGRRLGQRRRGATPTRNRSMSPRARRSVDALQPSRVASCHCVLGSARHSNRYRAWAWCSDQAESGIRKLSLKSRLVADSSSENRVISREVLGSQPQKTEAFRNRAPIMATKN